MSQLGYNTNRTNSTPFTILPPERLRGQKSDAEIRVRCDVFSCSEHASGTRRQLQRRGWGIYAREEFCPLHESEN